MFLLLLSLINAVFPVYVVFYLRAGYSFLVSIYSSFHFFPLSDFPTMLSSTTSRVQVVIPAHPLDHPMVVHPSIMTRQYTGYLQDLRESKVP